MLGILILSTMCHLNAEGVWMHGVFMPTMEEIYIQQIMQDESVAPFRDTPQEPEPVDPYEMEPETDNG